MRAADDVEMMAESDCGEVREAIEVWAAGERRKWGPGGGGGIEEEGPDEGGIGGEEAEDVARGETEEAAERGDGCVGEKGVPRAGGGAEAGAVGVGERD